MSSIIIACYLRGGVYAHEKKQEDVVLIQMGGDSLFSGREGGRLSHSFSISLEGGEEKKSKAMTFFVFFNGREKGTRLLPSHRGVDWGWCGRPCQPTGGKRRRGGEMISLSAQRGKENAQPGSLFSSSRRDRGKENRRMRLRRLFYYWLGVRKGFRA